MSTSIYVSEGPVKVDYIFRCRVFLLLLLRFCLQFIFHGLLFAISIFMSLGSLILGSIDVYSVGDSFLHSLFPPQVIHTNHRNNCSKIHLQPQILTWFQYCYTAYSGSVAVMDFSSVALQK